MTTATMIQKVQRLAETINAADDIPTAARDSYAIRRLRSIAREHGDPQHVGWVFSLYAQETAQRIAAAQGGQA
jgi:hypothetical protein